ncbi:hypothetical protein [Hymenobacter sp. B81]|uniref:hypothetical protein n=1 Tax=Hymenobacter sp. B81 TaxID=3344878 RepID=UPI0037DD5FA5
MINGKEYSYQDIQATMLGRPVAGLTAIEYGEKADRKFIWGTGRRPIAYANGQIEADGTLTLLQSEFEALTRGLRPGQSVTTIPPFDIIVMYIPDEENPVIVKDVLKSVLLLEFKKGGKAGDLNMPITLPFACAEVKLNQQ